MTQSDLISVAKAKAAEYGLDGALVCAVVEQESGWNAWLNRAEPDFEASPKYGPIVKAEAHEFAATSETEHGYETTWTTEIRNRCTSWGLMQTMGQVARELGFTGPIPSLCDVSNGLEIGCMELAKKWKGPASDFHVALLHYNGGADPEYPQKVLARIKNYQ